MPEKYTLAGFAIVIDALVIAVVTAALAMLYWLVTGAKGDYPAIVSNMLFLEGGIILTFGALVGFFKTGKTQEIRRLLFNPLLLFERLGFFQSTAVMDNNEEEGASWLLIFLGALLIIFSLLTSINYLI